ncbi:transposase domain-containing protein [Enterobacter hormaechei subsp. xiangfangensis]
MAAGLFSESKRCLPSKLSFCSKNPCPHTFRKWCSQIPESLFNFTGIRTITEVLDKLDLKLSNHLGDSVAPSAIPQARKRLTAQPLEALFKLTAAHWTQQEDSDDKWFGLSLLSVDGTQFRTHDTACLAEHFQYIKYNENHHTEY